MTGKDRTQCQKNMTDEGRMQAQKDFNGYDG